MNYLIIGASSGLGRQLAFKFAENKNNLVICSRDKRDLDALKSDLENKFSVEVRTLETDLTSEENIRASILSDDKFLESLDGILFPVGLMHENDNVDLNFEKINNITRANFISIAHIISSYLRLRKNSTIIGFGSVSGYLGRDLNTYYAASKRALESFFESIGVKNKKNETKIQFYILGYLETNLSFGKNLHLPKGSTKKLSEIVYKNRNLKFKKIYFPKWWFIIIFFLKIIPFSILLMLFKN